MKPKNMTKEQESAWMEKESARKKAWRELNLEKLSASQKAYREENREKVLAKNKAYREENREKVLASKKADHIANRKALKDPYIAHLLRMKRSEAPPELLELKREQIRLTRLTRELKKELQNV